MYTVEKLYEMAEKNQYIRRSFNLRDDLIQEFVIAGWLAGKRIDETISSGKAFQWQNAIGRARRYIQLEMNVKKAKIAKVSNPECADDELAETILRKVIDEYKAENDPLALIAEAFFILRERAEDVAEKNNCAPVTARLWKRQIKDRIKCEVAKALDERGQL